MRLDWRLRGGSEFKRVWNSVPDMLSSKCLLEPRDGIMSSRSLGRGTQEAGGPGDVAVRAEKEGSGEL